MYWYLITIWLYWWGAFTVYCIVMDDEDFYGLPNIAIHASVIAVLWPLSVPYAVFKAQFVDEV